MDRSAGASFALAVLAGLWNVPQVYAEPANPVPLDKNADPRSAEGTVESVVRRLRDEPIAAEELEEARASLVRRIVLRGGDAAFDESESSPGQLLDRISRVDERDVAAAARRYLPLDRRMIAELVPSLYASHSGEVDSLEDMAR